MLLTVTVPDGLGPGDSMLVAAPDGQEFSLCVPDGCFGGSSIDVELPVAEQPSPATTLVSLTVPDGLCAGMEMNVDWGGVAYTIAVPDGSVAGDEITIELPVLEAADPTGGAAAPSLEEDADLLLSFMMAEMSTADDDCAPLLPPPPPPRLKRPPEPQVPALAEPCPHLYKPGQRVHVLRSNGAVTLATVEYGFEMLFDTLYQVRTDDGLMKAAVPEEELSDAPDAAPDPWSGFTDFMMGDDD